MSKASRVRWTIRLFNFFFNRDILVEASEKNEKKKGKKREGKDAE